jgi:AraC-like DNA-binding protein
VAELLYFADVPRDGAQRFLPAGTLELVVNLDQDEISIHDGARVRRHEGAVVSGAYHSYFGIDARGRSSVIAVHFRPGGAWPFLGVAPGELADVHVDLSVLWGARAGEMRERLCAASTPALRFDILEQALVERLVHARAGHPAVPRAIGALEAGGVRVADVARELGLSHRRLVDVFTAEVGIGPKAFARIARFRHALARARREHDPDWADLAQASGYCDQSHLVREFVALAGDSPTALLARATGRATPLCHEGCRLA